MRFWSEDQKEYRRQWNINHPEVSRMKGKTHSLETRIKMSHQRQGFLNGNWKNGITARVRRLRTTKEYLQWKKLVIDRAKGVCRKCGDSTELYAHHIISIFKDITLATNPSNGLAVCVRCHRSIHASQ